MPEQPALSQIVMQFDQLPPSNNQLLRMHWRRRKQLLDAWIFHVGPETGQDFAAICRRVLETGLPHAVEDELNMIVRRPGERPQAAYFNWSLHRIRLPGEEGWGLINTAWETTAHKQAEERLRESEQIGRAH